MDNGLNNTLVIAAVLTLAGILGLIGLALSGSAVTGLLGFIALLLGLAVGIGELVGKARHKRANHSS